MHNKRKIFIGTSVHRWNDNRVFYKEAVSLAKHFDVELHAPADFEKKQLENVTIIGLPQWQKESDRKAIRIKLWNRLKKSNADVFIFHDPELIWIGIKARILFGKKVVYDVHENTVASIKRKKWLGSISKLIAISGYSIMQWISRWIFDHFILAEHSYKEVIKKKATVVLNYPVEKEWPRDYEKIYDLVYLGDVTEDRGGVIIIDLIKKLTNNYPELKLAVVGKVEKNAQMIIEEKIDKLKLRNHVFLFGHVNYPEAMEIVYQSKIGLCLLKPIENYVYSYPTKLFDYMQAGVPFVCSNFLLYEKLVNECEAGVTVNPLDVEAVANKISNLFIDSVMYDRLSQNGINALKKYYNWISQEKKLIEVINSILS